MATKVPKFGAWEGGENYTVCFDNARKTKNNGAMINPNDPQENPEMFQQPAHNRAEPKGQQSKVPQFGAWDNGSNAGYTVYFENARKTKNSGPTTTDPTTKSEPKETPAARPKVPKFGEWEAGGEGEVAYTACFDNVRKNKAGTTDPSDSSNEPQLNRDVAHQEAHSKVPQFGAWENGGENAAYTAYFDNARKNKSGDGAGNRARPPPSAATKPGPQQRGTREDGHLRNASRGSTASSMTGSEAPLKQGRPAKTPPRTPARNQTPEKGATIPPFGVWNNDPAQAEDFTGTFMRAKVDKNTPPSYRQQTHQPNQPAKQGGCFSCSIL